MLVDFYSDFIEVKDLHENTSTTVIEFLTEQFSRYSIPDTLATDNGPQFTSQEFRQFSQDWEFLDVSSSPHHKSNGKVESPVKVAKELLKKALRDDKDPWLAMLDQRNTPTESLGTSPAQRLMSRCTKTFPPTATNLLHPRVRENVGEKLKLKRQKAKWYHDRSACSLPEIDIGQDARVAPLQRNETWTQGTCVDKLSDRSYMVKMDASNQLLRRNREFLKPAVKPAVPSEPVEVDKSQPVNSNTQPTVDPSTTSTSREDKNQSDQTSLKVQ